MRSAENEFAQEHGGDECSESVERLCQVQAAGGCFRVSQRGYIRVGSRFEEAHSGGDDKENTEIGPVFFQHGCREKEQSAACCQEQSEYDTGFVAVFLHKHGNRYGEYEIGQPIGGFGERCFECVQFAGFHQLPDHGRQQVAADGPQEEEAENQYEWNDVFIFFHGITFIYSDMFLI